MDRDYYEILGINRDADKKTIKDAYHRLAMKFHPDRNPSPDAAEKFKEISKAYAILSDDKKRANYDASGFEGVAQYTQEDLFGGLDLSSIFGDTGFGLGGSIFESIFGQETNRTSRGQDLVINIQVPLEVINTGGKQKIRFARPATCPACHGYGTKNGAPAPKCMACNGSGRKVISRDQSNERKGHISFQQIVPCPDCHGQGVVLGEPCAQCSSHGQVDKIETLNINIPKGIEEGTILRVPGHGLPSAIPQAKPGNLHVRVYSAPDSRFERRGHDLWREEYIDVLEAVLGGQVKVPTLSGDVQVTVPAGTQPDEILRLRNKGLSKGVGNDRGDMHLRIRIRIPTHLTTHQKHLFEELRKFNKQAAER